ncbi:MAG: gliding motility-associated C-terminal domain-containing protein [Bacteroidota bacterium]
MRRLLLLLWLLPIISAFSFSANSQAFLCDDSFYVIAQGNDGSFLEAIQKNADNEVVSTRKIELSAPERQYTCLGMSIADMHLYALDFNTKELLRINALGEVSNLGVPENLNLDLEYWAGDVAPEGRRLVVIGRDKASGKDQHVFTINLVSENHYAGSAGIVSNFPAATTDLAIDPIRGVMYGYDKNQKQIIVIGTNNFTHYQHQAVEPFLEGLFFDKHGHLFAFGGSEIEQSILYAVDKITGEVQALEATSKGRYSDGCSCPYRMKFYREIEPKVLTPCQEFTIHYTILNEAGQGKASIYFEDVLPEEVTILEMTEHSFTLATVESGAGSNKLVIPNLDVLIGKNVITIKARLNQTDSTAFETQAELQGLAIGLGGEMQSDNPNTSILADANVNRIQQAINFELEDYATFACEEKAAILQLPFTADRYLWSDGSTANTLRVEEAGWYAVEAESACFKIKDSIYIEDFPETLSLDLGADVQVQQGASFPLYFQTNADSIQHLLWSSSGNFDLSCTDCFQPLFTALQSNTFYLELTNERGCTAKDSLHIEVEAVRNIYAPTAFSPNGDGRNEVFYLRGISATAALKSFQVFDRWGNEIFRQKDIPINEERYGWNGFWKNERLSTGTYAWVAEVEFLDGKRKILSGEVSLLP